MKEETRVEGPWEFGNKPMWNEDRKDIWESARAAAKLRKFDDIPAAMYCRYSKSFHFIAELAQSLHPPKAECRGIWIHGEAGTGKTSKAQSDFRSLFYIKTRNQWWDGYRDEKIVIMEDLDPESGKYIAGPIKDWTDRYSFKGNVKNSSAYPNHDWFIITSQYTIEQCFED